MHRASLIGLGLVLAGTQPAVAPASTVDAYGGLAAWIDVYDAGPWQRPERTIGGLARRDVATVFVQTSNAAGARPIHRPRALARLLAAAQRARIDVIAWSLPGFDDPRRDWRRVKAAVRYESAAGHRFDGFALDIEATSVRDIAVRNRRMLRLSSRLRRLVGARYALGAIVPDPLTQRYWPRFPWRAVRARFDVLLPMSYWTFHLRGEARVYGHARDTLRTLRARTGDRSVPVHLIGGIASHASNAEVRGLARATVDFGAVGASLYDAPITRPDQWRGLRRVARMRGSSRRPHGRLTRRGDNLTMPPTREEAAS